LLQREAKPELELQRFKVVVVSHYTGFEELGVQQMSDENRKKIEKNGDRVLT